MKVGLRTPSIKKSIKAQTTGKVKRKVKSAVNPLYGKKGMGLINDPKKAIYNKVYNKTTVGVRDIVKDVASSDNKPVIKVSENYRTNPNYCANCGSKLSETAKFCSGCGEKINKK